MPSSCGVRRRDDQPGQRRHRALRPGGSAYDAWVATLEDLEGALENLRTRVTAVETSQTDYPAMASAIKAVGETQQLLADVLRGFGTGLRDTADDSNQRIRSLEASAAQITASVGEIKTLLAQALTR